MNRDFKGVWIPREIWLNPDLSMQAKALWAEIYSLHDRALGGCSASDDHLMNFIGLKQSRLHEVMKELRNAGLVEKISFNGRLRVIRAIVPQVEYGGTQPSGKPEPTSGKPESSLPENRNPLPENRNPHLAEKNPAYLIEDNIIYNSKDSKSIYNTLPPTPLKGEEPSAHASGSPVPVASSFSSQKMKKISSNEEEKNSFGEHGNCQLSKKQYDLLLSKFGQAELDYWIEVIDLEAEKQGVSTFAKKYKSHYATILSWKRMRKEKGQEIKSHLAPHRQNSKLAFEKEPDTWRPVYANKVKRAQ